MSDENYINENYTFTKDTYINNNIDSSMSFDFYSKNHLNDVLKSMIDFLQAGGYPYVTKLIAVTENGEEHSSDEDIDEDIIEILNTVLSDLDMAKKNKSKPKLEVVVSNDNTDPEPPDTSG